MKTHERILATYAGVALAAGAVAWWRGKRGKELVQDSLLQGAVFGTGVNVVVWLYTEGSGPPMVVQQVAPPAITARGNACGTDMGKLASDGVALLSSINAGKLYKPTTKGGVKIGPVPSDPHTVGEV